jgi:hypothetical protein
MNEQDPDVFLTQEYNGPHDPLICGIMGTIQSLCPECREAYFKEHPEARPNPQRDQIRKDGRKKK